MINKIVNVLFIGACAVFMVCGGFYIRREIRLREFQAMSADRDPAPVKVGQVVDIPEVHGKETLLLELSPSCSFCLSNEPLYKKIKDLPQVRSGRVQVVIAMSSPDPDPARLFVERDSIPGKLIVANGADNFKFPFYATPTILLLDQNGKIAKMWAGALHGNSEASFIKALS